MKIWKIVLYVVAIVAFASCGTYTQAPKIFITPILITIIIGDHLLIMDHGVGVIIIIQYQDHK